MKRSFTSYLFILITLFFYSCTGCFGNQNAYRLKSFNEDRGKMIQVSEASVALISISRLELELEKLESIPGPTNSFYGIYCSAFFVGKRAIMTAAHCVEERDFIFDYSTGEKIILSSKKPAIGNRVFYTKEKQADALLHKEDGKFWEATVAILDLVNDIAILTIDKEAEGCEAPLRLSKELPFMGDEVFSVGHPSGLAIVITKGLFSSYHPNKKNEPMIYSVLETIFSPYEAYDYMLATTKIWFGNSGGVLLNKNGEIIGLASMIASSVPHLGLFSNTLAIRDVLKEYSEKHN